MLKLHTITIALIVIAGIITAEAKVISRDLIWNFNLFADPDSQGWNFNNFDKVEVNSATGILHLEFDGTRKDKQPELVQPSYFKSFVPAADYGAFEVRMKATVKNTVPEQTLLLCLKWKRKEEKTSGIIELPVFSDTSYHVYRFELTKAAGWAGKNDFVNVSLLPIFRTGGAGAAIDIDYIRFVPTPSFALKEKIELIDTRLTGAELLAAGLEKRGIKVAGVSAELPKLRQDLTRLAKDGSATLASFDVLEKAFADIAFRLDCGRRLEMLNESATSIADTLAFRREQGEKIITGAGAKADVLRQQLQFLAKMLKDGNIAGASARLGGIEKDQAALWNELCVAREWQAGISNASFGRYGWGNKTTGLIFQGNGKDYLSRGGYFELANGYNQTMKFSPVGATCTAERNVREVTWVSAEWEYPYKSDTGKNIKWRFKNSMLAPGMLLDTDAAAVRFAINSGMDSSPTKMLAPTRQGLKILPFVEGITKIDLAENWLLLLCDDGSPAAPWLLTFQKQPESFNWTKDALTIQNSAGLGIVGITNPWGIRPLPVDFSKSWNTPPESAVAQCRRIAAIMTCYPYKCDEYFTVDKTNGAITVAEKVHHYRIENDWKAKGEEIAPVPPVLAFAIANGYPATLPKNVIDCNLPTIYGPYLAQAGKKVEYTLPIPDLRNSTPLCTDAFPQWRKDANELVKTFYPIRYECHGPSKAPLSGQCAVFPSWNLLDGKLQQVIAENTRASLLAYFDIQQKIGSFDLGNGSLTSERAEPFTGLPYQVYGWTVVRNGQRVYGDISNFSGFKLYLCYLYAKYTGDWQLIRDNWGNLSRIFEVCPRTCDWAVMGQSCMEDYFLHSIDMGPDSWCAPVAMAQLADAVGDRRAADVSLYMAAKQAVPLVAAFNKRKWDTQYNSRWNVKENEQMPETGYTDSGYVGGDWKRTGFDYNFIIGCVLAPECVNLYRDYCPEAAANFEYDLLERFYPQWKDPKFIKYGKNSPGPLTRHLLLREALGESTEKLAEIARAGLLEGTGENIAKYLDMGGLPWLKSTVAATLIGRDAPCRLADWIPARLQSADFDKITNKVTARFKTSAPFNIRVISSIKPVAVALNGKMLSTRDWTYSAIRQDLQIPANATGEVTLTLDYAGWSVPKRQVIVPQGNAPVTPEQLICMNERQRRKTSAVPVGSYQVVNAEPIDLSSNFNMRLAAASAGNHGWLGKIVPPGQSANGGGVSGIPKGLQLFCGVPFVIAASDKGAIGLAGSADMEYPRRITINLNKPFKKLYFLQTAENAGENGAAVMRYNIKYADGSSTIFEARLGKEIGTWTAPKNVSPAKLAKITEKGQQCGLYVMAWENTKYEEIAVQNADIMQRPIRKIASVEIETTGKSGVVAVLAITGEML